MALDFLPARKKESWYFIQHKLPLLYSLGVNKVIVGKVECAVHVDGLLLHKKDPSLLLAGHKCSTVFLPRQGEFRIRFPENPPLGLWVLAHSRGDFRPGGGAAPPAGRAPFGCGRFMKRPYEQTLRVSRTPWLPFRGELSAKLTERCYPGMISSYRYDAKRPRRKRTPARPLVLS